MIHFPICHISSIKVVGEKLVEAIAHLIRKCVRRNVNIKAASLIYCLLVQPHSFYLYSAMKCLQITSCSR